jgi:uncharacterized OsmC-like protein
MSNPLKDSGKPLFFRVENSDEIGFSAPEIRKGEAVRLAIRSLSAMQKEALVASARSGAVWRLASDEGAYLDGQDGAPCPLAFFTTGMIASTMNEILALAEQRHIAIDDIRLVQDNYYTMQGSALKGTMVGGARNVELEAQIKSDASRETLTRLVADATAASPLSGLMRETTESQFTLSHNRREIETGRALPIGGPTLADPGDRFDGVRAANGDWSGLIRRNGMTPQTAETTSYQGSSLAENQDRTLHVRGICTLRGDGMRQIEQHIYNPRGSIFHFLCEESPENGGKGCAPDAASYISAGIGFCFMTQFGRYAKIVRKPLAEYRILQDTHFSLGGGSGGTGKPGETDPVETHVYLKTGEDDEFARTALDMSEQTCFLHAFCKAELKAKIRITGLEAAKAV